jgi:hypothetical protein
MLRAAAFLAEDAGVPHVQWLPYGGVLATLARLTRRCLDEWSGLRGGAQAEHRAAVDTHLSRLPLVRGL